MYATYGAPVSDDEVTMKISAESELGAGRTPDG